MNGASCGPDPHCVTCADEAIPMWVLEVCDVTALCVDQHGTRHEVAVELIAPVEPAQRVLVHAGVAIG